jgi:hypothetical protein
MDPCIRGQVDDHIDIGRQPGNIILPAQVRTDRKFIDLAVPAVRADIRTDY